jgi:hypothetical protein
MVRAKHMNTRALTIRKAGDTPKWLLRKKASEDNGLEYIVEEHDWELLASTHRRPDGFSRVSPASWHGLGTCVPFFTVGAPAIVDAGEHSVIHIFSRLFHEFCSRLDDVRAPA